MMSCAWRRRVSQTYSLLPCNRITGQYCEHFRVWKGEEDPGSRECITHDEEDKKREVPLKNGGEASAAPSILLHVLHACLDKKVDEEGKRRRVSQPPIIFFSLLSLFCWFFRQEDSGCSVFGSSSSFFALPKLFAWTFRLGRLSSPSLLLLVSSLNYFISISCRPLPHHLSFPFSFLPQFQLSHTIIIRHHYMKWEDWERVFVKGFLKSKRREKKHSLKPYLYFILHPPSSFSWESSSGNNDTEYKMRKSWRPENLNDKWSFSLSLAFPTS